MANSIEFNVTNHFEKGTKNRVICLYINGKLISCPALNAVEAALLYHALKYGCSNLDINFSSKGV
jgi:hypothetical protein